LKVADGIEEGNVGTRVSEFLHALLQQSRHPARIVNAIVGLLCTERLELQDRSSFVRRSRFWLRFMNM
jgi:hypothetical protein